MHVVAYCFSTGVCFCTCAYMFQFAKHVISNLVSSIIILSFKGVGREEIKEVEEDSTETESQMEEERRRQ